MRRTVTQTLEALEGAVRRWANQGGPNEAFVLPYPPEHELSVLSRGQALVETLSNSGVDVDWVDLGASFATRLDAQPAIVDALLVLDERKPARAVRDLATLASDHVAALAKSELPEGSICRILANTGSLATLVSFSSVLNATTTSSSIQGPLVLLFPGEDDEKSLNLLGLRADTNYRTARI